jgi:hypothetical protein
VFVDEILERAIEDLRDASEGLEAGELFSPLNGGDIALRQAGSFRQFLLRPEFAP